MSVELSDDLVDSPQSYSFIALRQYLQRQGVDPSIIRYRCTPSLAHPAGEISGLSYSGDGDGHSVKSNVTIDVSLMGLYGTTSPLPTFYTEKVIGCDNENSELKQFYDLFNHQAISLLYDAWGKYRFSQRLTLRSTQYENQKSEDEFSTSLLALWGIDKRRLETLKHLTMSKLIPLAGLLACRLASIELLTQALNMLFKDVDVVISSLHRSQINIPDDQLNGLGVENAMLGESLMLGESVVDGNGIIINVKLKTSSQLRSWLPGNSHNEMARELISLLLDTPIDYAMKIILDEPINGGSSLGLSGGGLGWGYGLGAVAHAEIDV